jgi:hypothetical protein
VRTAFCSLAERSILPLTAFAIASWALVPAARKKVLLSWAIFSLIVGAMGMLARPGVLRTVYPMLCSLLVLPLLAGSLSTARKTVLLAAAVSALALTVMTTHASNAAMTATERKVTQDMSRLDRGHLYVVWGGTLSYEAAYPVFGSAAMAREYRWYPLGAFSLAPFAIAQWQEERHRGLMDRLLNGPPLAIIANDELLNLLTIFLKQHYGRNLKITESRPLNTFHLFEIPAEEP